ncbi:hypothetical protein [Demequina rhizosphaerae]|uniref:hypothetical protein n=1 Tax=Demequina rhizosphaerae TaxID=1638985 RepID=UPI000B158990|nr:hypothetical protein [Demequina rhizosphaerae]
MARRRVVRTAAALTAGACAGLLGACSGDDAEAPTGFPTGAEVVMSTSTCTVLSRGNSVADDGTEVVTEEFECVPVASDPRVTGTESMTFVTTFAPGEGDLAGLCTGESTLTTDEGSWRGTALCVVDAVGVLPQAEGERPFNDAEMTYVGEGAYEGLEYRYIAAGTNGRLAYAGWIYEAE